MPLHPLLHPTPLHPAYRTEREKKTQNPYRTEKNKYIIKAKKHADKKEYKKKHKKNKKKEREKSLSKKQITHRNKSKKNY